MYVRGAVCSSVRIIRPPAPALFLVSAGSQYFAAGSSILRGGRALALLSANGQTPAVETPSLAGKSRRNVCRASAANIDSLRS